RRLHRGRYTSPDRRRSFPSRPAPRSRISQRRQRLQSSQPGRGIQSFPVLHVPFWSFNSFAKAHFTRRKTLLISSEGGRMLATRGPKGPAPSNVDDVVQ